MPWSQINEEVHLKAANIATGLSTQEQSKPADEVKTLLHSEQRSK